MAPHTLTYPWWRLIYLLFSLSVIGGVFAFLHYTTFGMVVRAGMADRETVGLLGIDIDRRFTIVFGLAASWPAWLVSCTRRCCLRITISEWTSWS